MLPRTRSQRGSAGRSRWWSRARATSARAWRGRRSGYYLLGLGATLPWLFEDMPWGTDAVLAITLRRLAERGIVPVLLDTLADLDRPEDLLRWPELGWWPEIGR